MAGKPPDLEAALARVAELEGQLRVHAARAEALEAERDAANQHHEALAGILRVINRSPGDEMEVFEAILVSAAARCETDAGIVVLTDGKTWVASVDMVGGRVRRWPRADASERRMALRPGAPSDAAILERRTIHVHGTQSAVRDAYPDTARVDELHGGLSVVAAPLMRDGQAIGSLVVRRDGDPRPFTPEQIRLLEAFADQAVIALENARLFRELEGRNREVSEALEREQASSEILRQISAAPEQLDDTLEAIAAAARRLTGSSGGLVGVVDGDRLVYGPGNATGATPAVSPGSRPLSENLPQVIAIKQQAPVVIDDVLALADDEYQGAAARARRIGGYRSLAAAPVVREGESIGVISVVREEIRPYTPADVAVLESFARQAAIAIENARLIGELRERNRDVSEALELQTVMAEVLGVIAGAPADLDTVLPQLAAAAAKLCEAQSVVITHGSKDTRRVWRTDDGYHTLEGIPSEEVADRLPGGVAYATNRPVRFAGPVDTIALEYPRAAEQLRQRGASEWSVLAVPLPGAEGPTGALVVSRDNAIPFTDRHVAILETFADQAVIAIENARLFRELEERNADLAATADVLRIVSQFSTDLTDVLEAVVSRAASAVGADRGFSFLVENGKRVGRGIWDPTGSTAESGDDRGGFGRVLQDGVDLSPTRPHRPGDP